jgi:hypothetical protein
VEGSLVPRKNVSLEYLLSGAIDSSEMDFNGEGTYLV